MSKKYIKVNVKKMDTDETIPNNTAKLNDSVSSVSSNGADYPVLKNFSVGLAQTREELAEIARTKKLSAFDSRNLLRQQKGLPVSVDGEKEKRYNAAQKNSKNILQGAPLEVTEGRIYTFEPLTRETLQKSIDWADSEIERLKKQGGKSSILGEMFANLGMMANNGQPSNRGKVIGDASEDIRELESYKSVLNRYLENIEYENAITRIKENGDEELFSELYAIDTRKSSFGDFVGRIVTANSGGISMPSGNSSDITRKEDISARLKEKYGEDFERFRELYAKGANAEYKSSVVSKMQEDIDAHPVLGTIGYTLGNIVTSPIRGAGAAYDNLMKASGYYGASSGSLFQDMSETTVQKVNDDINEAFNNKYAAGFVRSLYNAAVSGAESMLSMGTFGRFGEVVLGFNAATNTYKSAKERGLSDSQSLMNGIAAGLFEALFEHLSLDNLRVFQASPSTSLKPFIKNALKQAFVEGTEEGFTDLANEAYDYLINGGLSQYEQALQNGMTAEEYASQFFSQLGETVFTGALSGGGMTAAVGGPAAVKGSIATSITDKATGSYIRQYEDVGEVLTEAKEQGGIVGKKAEIAEKRIAAKKSVSDRTIGQIDRISLKKQREATVDEILKGEEYSKLTKKEKNAIRSSVLSFLNTGGQVAPEQSEVLDTENGKKVLDAAREWESNKVSDRIKSAEGKKSSEIRTAVSEKNTESLVRNTFEAKNAEGYAVEAGAVRSITDGVFEVVQDESGATARLSELKIKDRQARELYNTLQSAAQADIPLSVEAANVALSMYNTYDNTSARMYALWAHDAYKAGALNFTFDEFEEMFHGKYEGDITKSQLLELFEVGARNITTTVGLTIIGHKGLSKHQAEQVFIAEQLAKKYGLELVLVDSNLSDGEGRLINGLYKEGTNRIVLSLNSDFNLLLVTAGHEMFHWVKNQNPAMGEYLQDTVISVLESDSKYDFDGIYKQVSEAYQGLSKDDILEEIAAQYMAVALSNENTISRIVNEATETERSFLQKILDHLKDFIKSVKELLKIYGSQDKTVRAAVETPVEQLEFLAELFEKALENAAKKKNPTTETGGVKASLSVIGLEEYSKESKNNIKMRGGLIVNSEAELRSYITEALNGNSKKNLHLGAIPKNVINQIEKDINAKIFKDKQYTFVVSYDDIRHVSEHFADVDELTNEIIRLYDILSNYDTVECLIEENGRKKLRLEKTYSHADYRSIEIVSNRTSSVDLISFYVMKKHNEKGSQSVPPATQGSLSGGARLPNSSVPQNAQSVNINDMQKGKKYSYAGVKAADTEYLTLAENPADNEVRLRELVERAAYDAGYRIRAYHGTARGDRVGNVFLPERATSGPMAFFTSSKEIATNYSHDKPDTSLAYDEEYSDYYTQFRVNRNGKSISVVDLWNMLSFSEKAAIRNKAPHITFDDNAEHIIYNVNKKYGVGGLDSYRINEHRGNFLSALVAEWLEDGNLYGEEHRFLDVLKLAGIEDAEYRDPDARHEKVYDTYLKIAKPFNTDNVDEAFVEGLESWYEEQDEEIYIRESADSDLWDKNNRTIEDVTEKLREDIEDGTTYTWTSIPDFLTDYLKSQGFDGIQDRGGKKGGDEHTVYIPFSSEQVKSAELVSYDDNGEIIPLSERFNPGKRDIRYSYAGVKAKTADIKTLDYAARLEDVGKASPEEIRQQTGWFRGYDNKWRFEISDRDMQIDTRGLFSMNPDVRRYTQLVDKAYFDMTATEEEMQELIVLEKNLEGVSVEPKTLGELIHHPALFEAYPQLKDVNVYFDDIEARGAYNSVFNAIYLQKKLKLDKNQLTKTLVHEIQHAVQHIEGFASGASASYWADFYKEDYEDLKNMRENLKLWLNDIKYFDYVKASMQEVTSKKKTLEQHWKDIENFKKNSKYAREIENCEKTISELEEKLPSPDALYERTAGEIEARDAAMRHWRTDEARKEKRPDIDRTDVVFADGELLSFDIKTDTEGNKFVEVNPELFDARDGESHAKTIARIIKDRFNNLISVNGQQIQINKTTNREWLRSESATYLAEKHPSLYLDKLKTIPYADEILKAANNWIGEKPNHKRKDDIVEFARGEVLYRVGDNGYIADVLVGIRSNGAAVLYSLKNIYEKEITDASLAMASESPQRSEETSVTDNISQTSSSVNIKYSRQLLSDTWDGIREMMRRHT